MPPPEIHIDRLQLELRGISPAVAQSALASFGPAVHEALTTHLSGRSPGSRTNIEQLTLPALCVPASADAATLRNALATRLATTIADRISTPPAPSPAR